MHFAYCYCELLWHKSNEMKLWNESIVKFVCALVLYIVTEHTCTWNCEWCDSLQCCSKYACIASFPSKTYFWYACCCYCIVYMMFSAFIIVIVYAIFILVVQALFIYDYIQTGTIREPCENKLIWNTLKMLRWLYKVFILPLYIAQICDSVCMRMNDLYVCNLNLEVLWNRSIHRMLTFFAVIHLFRNSYARRNS